MIIESLATFIIASTLLALAPGPDNVFVLMQSALYGTRAGILITLGLCTGLLFHTGAVVFGVASLVESSSVAFTLLKMTGGFYLLYLAWQIFSSPPLEKKDTDGVDNNQSLQLSVFQLYRRGIIMNLSNPKVLIFFLAFLPQFVDNSRSSIELQLLILGAIFIFITLLVFSIIAVLSGSLGIRLKKSSKTEKFLKRVAGMVFIGLAFKLFFAEYPLI